MILFTFLITLLLVIAIVTIVFGFVVGAGFIVMFGDVIICALIIALIIRHFMKKYLVSGVSNDSCFSRN